MLADAETVEFFPAPFDERRAQQDLEALQESLLWTGEDIRQARGFEDAPGLITEEDTAYISQHYAALRRARGWAQLQQLGYAIRDLRWQDDQPFGRTHPASPASQSSEPSSQASQAETARPRWYQERIQALLGITIPLPFAQQFYRHLITHKWLMSERARMEVSLEDAAQDWYKRYHLPAITLLRTYFPSESDSLEVYLGVLAHKWELSVQAGFEVSLEEAALDYALQHAREAPVLHRAFNAVSAVLPHPSELGQLVRKEQEPAEDA